MSTVYLLIILLGGLTITLAVVGNKLHHVRGELKQVRKQLNSQLNCTADLRLIAHSYQQSVEMLAGQLDEAQVKYQSLLSLNAEMDNNPVGGSLGFQDTVPSTDSFPPTSLMTIDGIISGPRVR